MATADVRLPSRRLDPQIVELLRNLKEGQRIKIVQTVRVGSRKWTTEITGLFRNINYLATGITTDRVPEDDVIVPTVHFTKDNGELSCITIDEHSRISLA